MKFYWLVILILAFTVGCQTEETKTYSLQEQAESMVQVHTDSSEQESQSEVTEQHLPATEKTPESEPESLNEPEPEPEQEHFLEPEPEPSEPPSEPEPEQERAPDPVEPDDFEAAYIAAPQTPREALDWAASQLPDNKRLLFSLYDFASEEALTHKGDKAVFPASLIKTLYLHVFLEEVAHDRQCLDQIYILQEEDKYAGGTLVAGMGLLQHEPAGTEITHRELLTLMVAESDNVATNIITGMLGFDLLNERIEAYGLKNTKANRRMFDAQSGHPDNQSSMNDMTTLLALFEEQVYLDEDLYNKAINIKADSHNTRIGRYAPQEVLVANKLGNVATLVSDMAIIYFPHREPIALSIMVQRTDGHRLNRQYGEEIIGNLSGLIMEYYLNS
ncbi:serine hydrolase [Dethiobacter alkaliphilus]|uniref:serine hydrolase n=1 Tax=Dethiobacter alkaliphilus TaxID=427926 RepID=UPI002225F96C|nr:serine hydrolase [Dethiobacter alkaliphilus]MCW3488843.1 class A beta-lactamase-related serine hydrolase [Dethiobacter alkaliphilus]